MGQATDIDRSLNGVGGGVDEGNGVGADGDHIQRPVVGREAQPMDEQLALVERLDRAGCRVAQADDAEQGVGGRVDDRDSVGGLVSRVDPVPPGGRRRRRDCTYVGCAQGHVEELGAFHLLGGHEKCRTVRRAG